MAYSEDWGSDEPKASGPRISLLAVLSLICGVVCIPGLGLLAVLFGGLGLARIARAGPAVGGKTLAIVGIVAGLAATSLWSAIFVGAFRQYQYTYTCSLRAAAVLGQIEAQQWDLVRPRLGADPGSESRLTDFRKRFLVALGSVKGSGLGSGSLQDFMDMRSSLKDFSGDIASEFDWGPIPPMPIRFERGTALVIFEPQPNTPAGSNFDSLVFANVMVLAPGKPPIRLVPLTPEEAVPLEMLATPDPLATPAPAGSPVGASLEAPRAPGSPRPKR